MFRVHFIASLCCFFALTAIGSAQSDESTASCNLDDGRQIYIRYNPVTTKSDKPSNGKPWTPGGTPMTLFTEAPLDFGGSSIPRNFLRGTLLGATARWCSRNSRRSRLAIRSRRSSHRDR